MRSSAKLPYIFISGKTKVKLLTDTPVSEPLKVPNGVRLAATINTDIFGKVGGFVEKDISDWDRERHPRARGRRAILASSEEHNLSTA